VSTHAAVANQKVEFELGSQTYCVDIEYITEVSDVKPITALPNSAAHVRGMMDLRGRTTSVVDPRVLFDVEGAGDSESVLVFDPETMDGATGWIVDEVTQVTDIADDAVHDPPADSDEAVRGVIRRDDEFVIWIEPTAVAN